DLSRLCVHTMTTKPWDLAEAIDGYTKAGIGGITVWRQALEPQGVKESAKMLKDSPLEVVSLCRGGFFPAETTEGRQEAIDDNMRAIDEAVEIGAPLIVLVCGAVPGMPLAQARQQIGEGIAKVIPHAEECGVKLSIEPLHPMYSDSRSAINTLAQANDIVDAIASPNLGVTVDVYHLWWDPDLQSDIEWSSDKIFSFHVCDWRTPTRDLLNDRGLMGEGCIPIRQIRNWVERGGFDGWNEVEIFSDEYWQMDQAEYLEKIKEAYLNHV
ncbi:MAG: sugar phosphate isomerase/epimerase family protein, partial [Candidatus Sumerlaeota bacterium]